MFKYKSLVYLLLTEFTIDSVLGFRSSTFFEEFCDAHEDEIEQIERKCNEVLHVEVLNIFGICIMEIRNRRARYKKIDGKYRQFVICDREIEEELLDCEKEQMSNLDVGYDIEKNINDYLECLYTELLVNKRLEERRIKEGGTQRPKIKKKKNKSGK